MPVKQATAAGKNPAAAAAAIDGDPQTGWSVGGGQEAVRSAVFQLAAPVNNASDLEIQLLFERYYAAGLGRFRISVTTDPQPIAARDIPAEIEELAADPARATDPPSRTRNFADTILMVAPSWPRSGRPSNSFAKACRPIPRPWSCKSGRPTIRGPPSFTTAANTFSRLTGYSPRCSRFCPHCPKTSLRTGWPWPGGWFRLITRCPGG